MKQPGKSSAERNSKGSREALSTMALSDTLPPAPRKLGAGCGHYLHPFTSGCTSHAGSADWRSKRAADSARRCRLRPDQHFRRSGQYADAAALADEGLRYNRFHTTALCSPSRAALLSGRNHHSVHTGCITELSTGFPGYDGKCPGKPRSSRKRSSERLQHGGVRQVAQHSRSRDQRRWAVRPLAHRQGLRLFLGVHGRRDQPMEPAASRKHRASKRRRRRSGTSPKRWPKRR